MTLGVCFPIKFNMLCLIGRPTSSDVNYRSFVSSYVCPTSMALNCKKERANYVTPQNEANLTEKVCIALKEEPPPGRNLTERISNWKHKKKKITWLDLNAKGFYMSEKRVCKGCNTRVPLIKSLTKPHELSRREKVEHA